MLGLLIEAAWYHRKPYRNPGVGAQRAVGAWGKRRDRSAHRISVAPGVAHGALTYLLKPFTFAAFRDRLERYLRYRKALPAGIEAASQAEVDRALAELRTSTEKSMSPKGVAPGTTDEIARAVRDHRDGVTLDQVAKQVGVSRVTALALP